MELKATKQRGFSVIEVLIASAIFLIIALGILPLFAQAIRNNFSGRNATDVSNFGKSRVEELLQVPFDSLVVPIGQTEAKTDEYYSLKDKIWKPGAPPSADPALWLRTTRVRQFSLGDLQATGTANPQLGGAAAGTVHLKEIVVEVRSADSNFLTSGKTLTLRTLRAV